MIGQDLKVLKRNELERSEMLIGICCVTSYFGLWFVGCLARHSVPVIQVDSSTRLLGERLASRLTLLCSLYLATSVDCGTAWLPQDFSVLIVVSTLHKRVCNVC